MSELNLEELDPGIREVVRRLRKAGFNTTDSGDGVSKPEMECALDVPNVHMVFPNDWDSEGAYWDTNRLLKVVTSWGVEVKPGDIQLTYCPVQESSILSLFNISDEDII